MIFAKIYLKHAKRSLGSLLILMLIVACISFLFTTSLRALDQFTQIIRIADNAGWRECVIYTRENLYDTVSDANLIEKSNIENLPSVQSVETTAVQFLAPDDSNGSDSFWVYSGDALSRIRYPLSEGRYPASDSYNQILLPPALHGQYKVGDQIHVLVLTNLPPGIKEEEIKTATLTVAGFLRENFLFTDSGLSVTANLSDYFKSISSSHPLDYIAFGIKTDDGEIVPPAISYTYIITPKPGFTVEQVKKDVASIVEYPAYVHAGPDLFDRYWKENVSAAKPVLAYCIASLSLSFSLLLGSTVLSMQRGRKTMLVYYSLGLTWPRTVAVFAFQKLPAILLGDALGILLYAQAGGGGLYPGADGLFLPVYAVITTALLLLFFTAAILPFYFSAVKKSPMELFGKE